MTDDLRVADLRTFLAVQRCGSVSGAARELRVSPSQVSKAIARLEAHFGMKLLSRGTRGVSLSEAGLRIVSSIANVIAELDGAHRLAPRDEHEVHVSIGGPSYLLSYLLPAIAERDARLRVRGLELAPAYLRAYIGQGLFEIALVPGEIGNRPAGWTSDPVGFVRDALFGTPAVARRLGRTPVDPDRLRDLPFIGPTATSADRFVALDDECPLPAAQRRIEHRVQTFATALELAVRTDHVVFGPIIAARRFVRDGALVEIPVRGWDTRAELFVVCDGAAVLSRVRTAVIEAVRAALADSRAP